MQSKLPRAKKTAGRKTSVLARSSVAKGSGSGLCLVCQARWGIAINALSIFHESTQNSLWKFFLLVFYESTQNSHVATNISTLTEPSWCDRFLTHESSPHPPSTTWHTWIHMAPRSSNWHSKALRWWPHRPTLQNPKKCRCPEDFSRAKVYLKHFFLSSALPKCLNLGSPCLVNLVGSLYLSPLWLAPHIPGSLEWIFLDNLKTLPNPWMKTDHPLASPECENLWQKIHNILQEVESTVFLLQKRCCVAQLRKTTLRTLRLRKRR